MSEEENEKREGRYAYEGLERVMHEKARLGIMTSLATHPEGLLFNELKELCSLTDGNLSRHIQVLQEAGLVEVWKRFQDRRPQTLCRLSLEGKKRFFAYLEEMERVLKDAQAVQKGKAKKKSATFIENPDLQGWTPT